MKSAFILRRYLILAALPLVAVAHAQPAAYPTKPIRMVVGFPPGGGNDIIARAVTDELTKRLAQTFFVDNRPGASTIIGAELAMKAVPDGYTLFVSSQTTLTCGVPSARIVAMWAKLGAARTDRTKPEPVPPMLAASNVNVLPVR